MIRTRQIQFFQNGAEDWDDPQTVHDFRWDDPDILILDEDGKEVKKYRVGAAEEIVGWRGGTVWISENLDERTQNALDH
jgi:hypothetical protein